ncbi:MAG: molybdopterin synthase sulfur carrier subunit [Nitrososphaeria archaeon]|nr:molybdopterin synthase sulfur carrier subunit [Nitrososphaeria archaeon]
MAVDVRVKLLGGFRVSSGRSRVTVKLGDGATVGNVVEKLIASSPPEFKEALIDPVLHEPLPNALILVNGKEVGVLDGVGTAVRDGDEVVFVPVTHGG